MGNPFIGVEATGVYKGVLVEDMIETVAREHKLYCNVYIEDFFQKESDYPLTFVPLWAMSLPLRKDDVVLIEFHQGNLMYPVLYKNDSELDEAFYENFEIPDFVDGNVEKPETKDTIGVTRLGVDSYIIKTDDYTVIHQNNGFILVDTEDNIYTYGTNVNLVANGNLKVDCSGDLDVKAVGDGHINIDSDDGEINVTSGGKTTITCNDETNITSEGALTVEAKDKTNITSSGELTIDAKNKTNITSQGDLSITAKSKTTVNSTGECSITSSNKTTIDSTGELKITSKNKASIESMAGTDIKVTGAAGVNITSGVAGVTINNHLKVL